MRETIQGFAKEALEQMPPETRLRPEDAAIIARHKDLLLSWSEEMVKAFYDILFAHPPTSKVFREGERPDREKTLTGWWRRTVEGPLDEDYFVWMAKVGIAHVFRGVKSPMMLAMSSFVAEFVEKKAHEAGLPEASSLTEAFFRLSATINAVVTHSYERYHDVALYNVAGIEPGLLERLSVNEAQAFLEDLRKEE